MERLLAFGLLLACSSQDVGAPNRLEIVVPEGDLAKGESTQLKALYHLDDGTVIDRTERVTWHSSNPSVAIIFPNGILRGRSAGSVSVDAVTADGWGATRTIVVQPARLIGLRIGDAAPYPTLLEGNRWYLNAVAMYSDEVTRDVTAEATWAASQPDVVMMGVAGDYLAVEARNAGVAKITATLGAREAFTSLTVFPRAPETLEVRVTQPALQPGEVAWLHAVGTYPDGSQRDLAPWVAWLSSSDSAMVVPDTAGTKMIAGRPGAAEIIALYQGLVARCEVEVGTP